MTARRYRMEWGTNGAGYIIVDSDAPDRKVVFSSDNRGETEAKADELNDEREPEPRAPNGGPRGYEYSEVERQDIRDAGRGHLLP